ncbi:MAG: hypothetical protein Q8R55_04710 [Candidatus Taylorbacteria bacterium]|nr:hypothetical protein [Candidatus Taylorbacteria bacterium]
MSKPKLISIIVGVIIIVGIAYVIWLNFKEVRPPAGGRTSESIFSFFGGQEIEPPVEDSISENQSSVTNNQPAQEPVTSNQLPVNNLTPQTSSSGDYAKLLREQGKIYEELDVSFRFLYPPDFTVTEIDDEQGYTILAQNSAKKAAFQIFLNPFDEPGPVTPARIKKDLPNLIIENPQPVLIGADKNIPALIFFSQDLPSQLSTKSLEGKSLGRTREIWFVGNGHLFQVETFADQDSIIGPVMDTWEFTK